MILVIGGSSFIGVYTVRALLDAGLEVVATGRNSAFKAHYASLGVPYLRFDLEDPDGCRVLPRGGVDTVILVSALLPANSNSALRESDNAGDYITVNTVGTARLLEYCRSVGADRLISTTSYGDVQNRWSASIPITESTPRDFKMTGDHAAYVISKNAASDLLFYYNEQHGMRNVVFRLPPVYGVGPHGTFLVNGLRRKSGVQAFIEQAQDGKPITVFGDVSIARDVVYVKDVASAFVAATTSESASGLYNIGSGVATSLLEQAAVIAEVFAGKSGRSLVRVDHSQPNGLTPYRFDISKAVSDFGYHPRFAQFVDLARDWKLEADRGMYATLFGGGATQ